MRVAMDMISAGSGFAPAAGGMTTYYEGLSKALAEVDAVEEVIAFLPAGAQHADLAQSDSLRIISCDGLGESRLARVAYEHLRFPGIVGEQRADVLLSTHNVKPLRWRGPSVVVLQSMQYFFIPDPIGFARRTYLRLAVPRSLRAAHRVIAVSEAARCDAIELFDLDPSRVIAVHHGCSPWALETAARFEREGKPPVPAALDPGRPYVVMVSSLYGMKNHRRLIEGFGIASRQADFPHALVIAGREVDVTHAELRDVARRYGLEERVQLLGAYPQENLPALLANADAVAYPSLYETFGHPVLEAFAFGRPLLTSAVGGAAEVAGGAAVTVDPTSSEAIAEGLQRLLENEGLRERLSAAGRARLRSFSWEKCANLTAATLRAAMEDD